jgi:putative transposase
VVISRGTGSSNPSPSSGESTANLSFRVGTAYQRCYVHFLRNALDHVPRRVDDDCLQELRWLYDRRDLIEAHRDLAAWLTRWSGKYSKLTG